MNKLRVFVTGATGGMGFEALKQMISDLDVAQITILVRDSEKNHKLLEPYQELSGLRVVWGDLQNYQDVFDCVANADLILHIAAFVSPEADYYPDKAMKNNVGSTLNMLNAIKEQKREAEVKFVYIGTVSSFSTGWHAVLL